jgi:methyl-accepting chemotaxis protein
MFLSKLSFRTLLTTVCLTFALVPLSIMTLVSWRAADEVAQSNAQEYAAIADTVGDKIDRNLFERYGDVQAFGLNAVVQNQDSWGKPGDENPIVRAMNQYIDLYDVYYLSLLVDAKGKLIAVNTTDSNGKAIDTAELYSRDFTSEAWFQDALAGRFYESADKKFTGTVVEHLYVDAAAQKIFGDEGLALGFSTPVRDADGNTIAVWKNVTKFRTVEDIVLDTYNDLKDRGLGSAEITLLDDKGNVIVDCDPTLTGVADIVRDMAVIGKFNLVDKGVDSAARVVKGEVGSLVSSWHARKQIDQCAGYAPLRGAMGFPGMKWNVLVRVASKEALATTNQVKSTSLWTFGGAVLAVVVGAYLLSGGISRILKKVVTSMEAATKHDYSQLVTTSLSRDLSRMCMALNNMLTSMTTFEEKAADYEGQIAAISKSQAVIEFNLDGTVRRANENFLNCLGYSQEEVTGQHHRIFCEPSFAQSAEYRSFWDALNRGQFQSGVYKRLGKGGKEVWIQASYNPIFDASGKPVKVVKYATDVTAQRLQNADYEGQINAVSKSQAVIEFNLDGTVVTANDNFLSCLGYALSEVKGQHHRMFCEPAYTQSGEYRAFWDALNRGEYQASEYKRIGKGGREIWIQASYNPILDLNGKPFKVVKYATDITEQKLAVERDLARTVKISNYQETEVGKVSTVLSAVADGDLTKSYAVATADGDTAEVGRTFTRIAAAVNAMCEKLRGVFGSLTTNAVQLASTSTELSATATQLAGGAEETTNQSATVAAAAEEMSTNMTNMAASTEQMTQNVRTVSSAVEELTASIGEIARTAGQTSTIASTAAQLADSSNVTIGQLGAAADEIGKVIEVIQDIAEQTNLLALNATIEAARAGEAGKGFAVVATEVKELAKQTANATQDIRTRIEGIQASTTEAVRSIKEVGDAIQKVNSASSTIAAAVEEQSITTKEIASNVHQTAIAASTVSTAVAESASACAEITRNMTGVDQAAKQTAQGATQTQVVGTELSHLSEQLRGMVSQFQV